MDITLDQAQAFEAIARLGTVQLAAQSLNKGHSAILYLIKALEQQTSLSLFDRSGYRNQVSPEGEVVLKYCRRMLDTRDELTAACHKLRSGWEPTLKIVYDAVIDFNLIADALFSLGKGQSSTQITVISAYLGEVEAQFYEKKADMMLTILPIHQPHVLAIPLKPVRMLLVAHKDYPLAVQSGRKISLEALMQHTFVRVREDSRQLGLSTEQLNLSSQFVVNDFSSKKLAIMKRLAYGWLPEYLLEKELKANTLKVLKTEISSEHVFRPHLYFRKGEEIGNTTKQLLECFH
jgi:DNA-binding transcriptional LysR family regulator